MTPFRISLALAGAVAALGTGAAFAAAGPTALSAFTNHGEAVSTAARTTCPDSTAADRDGHGDCVSKVARSEAGEKKSSTGKHQPETATPGATKTGDKTNHGDVVSDVAKSKSTEGEAHGDAVSAVAKANAGHGTTAAVTQDGHGDSIADTHSTTPHSTHR